MKQKGVAKRDTLSYTPVKVVKNACLRDSYNG